ncbi:hypothetical protein RJ639_006491 [Escallonia herrerae]|uniref:HhH-GPD domain-containing protein n=1 Tax=Escallonia herrerae TaxID=1293975 RepID=A0AA88VZ85_9ASTE|nr:hypothetical protein RJ639_006491 [Escallonia herrerae]
MGDQAQSQPPDSTAVPPDSNSTPGTEPPSDLSQNPPNASKIPIRPQKIRKLSSYSSLPKRPPPPTDTDGDDSKAIIASKPTATPTTTTTTITTTTSATKPKRRNSSHPSSDLPKVIKPLSALGEISLALQHLRSSDPLIADLIDAHPPPTFDSHQPPFLALTKSILYQQLANKAGTSVYSRFTALCGGENGVRPETVLALSTHELKQIGVSARKASYLYDLANKYSTGILSDDLVVRMDDKSLFTLLSMVKGIGSWSVHMFMIFSLHRPDVLPVSDLGVRKGVQLLYGLEELPRPSQMDQLCEKWRPYRSVGAWYMWRLVEGKGSQADGAAAALVQPLQQVEQQQQTQQQHQLQMLDNVNGGVGNYG